MGVVNASKAREKPVYRDESALFSAALGMHLDSASATDDLSIKIDSLGAACVIALFSRLTEIDLEWSTESDSTARFGPALLRELADVRETRAGEEIDGDVYTAVIARRRAIREIRCDGDLTTAADEADRDDREFAGVGADHHRAEYQVELMFALLLDGRAGDARERLAGSGFWKAAKDYRYPSEHRFHYADGLGAWADGDLTTAAGLLERAHRHLRRTGGGSAAYDIEDLVVSLARADLLASFGDRSVSVVNEVVDRLEDALRLTERIRQRWGVVSRSRSPLSVAFRRIYGDIARVAAVLTGRQAAEIGLRAVLSAKQTGFAGLMRAGRTHVPGRRLRNLIEQAVAAENEAVKPSLGGEDLRDTDGHLAGLRQQIVEVVSPMLADLVLPVPPNVARVIDAVGDRYAIDYVALPDSLDGATMWFRTLIEPSGAISFDSLVVGSDLGAFIGAVSRPGTRLAEFFLGDPDWRGLAAVLLPATLVNRLTAAPEQPSAELVVSAHSALSLMPWAALELDDGIRLVHRAVLMQTPVLTALSGNVAGAVTGPAVVQLVARSAGGVDVGRERRSWRLAAAVDGQVPLSRCSIGDDAPPVELTGTFAAALSETGWGFAHVAAHGQGSGLDQSLDLPGGRVSAGQALTLPWPASVLMASCDVGRLMNIDDGEPINFVMALLAGGSDSVVACIDEVDDQFTGAIAEHVVKQIRDGTVPLRVALRDAVEAFSGGPEQAWSLITAYGR
ncbi:CHAT domain-containing protein [Actinoplanes italicus]|uniref:CHAT domain-containing protein n=1 Tax=Actinoplanes italicus TaxID=113567 RepID=A0A2T0KIM9_9ACTN|nr:CHAT domain-containing protein [Actinoplanes italicus]